MSEVGLGDETGMPLDGVAATSVGQNFGIDVALHHDVDDRARVQVLQHRDELLPGLGVGDVGLGDDDAVGEDRRLTCRST